MRLQGEFEKLLGVKGLKVGSERVNHEYDAFLVRRCIFLDVFFWKSKFVIPRMDWDASVAVMKKSSLYPNKICAACRGYPTQLCHGDCFRSLHFSVSTAHIVSVDGFQLLQDNFYFLHHSVEIVLGEKFFFMKKSMF